MGNLQGIVSTMMYGDSRNGQLKGSSLSTNLGAIGGSLEGVGAIETSLGITTTTTSVAKFRIGRVGLKSITVIIEVGDGLGGGMHSQ